MVLLCIKHKPILNCVLFFESGVFRETVSILRRLTSTMQDSSVFQFSVCVRRCIDLPYIKNIFRRECKQSCITYVRLDDACNTLYEHHINNPHYVVIKITKDNATMVNTNNITYLSNFQNFLQRKFVDCDNIRIVNERFSHNQPCYHLSRPEVNFFLIANTKSLNMSHLTKHIHTDDIIVHFNQDRHHKILKQLKCKHHIFLNNSGDAIWGYENFSNQNDFFDNVYLREYTKRFDNIRISNPITYIPDMPCIKENNKEFLPSAGFSMIKYLEESNFPHNTMTLVGFTFAGWVGHDWCYEKQYCIDHKIKIV